MRSYPITPVPKPRMTRRDRWLRRPCVLRYWAFKDECQLRRVHFNPGDNIRFVMPMPKSWSKKQRERMCGEPHEQENADTGNLMKALEDAIFKKDGHVWKYGSVQKVWGYQGAIQIWSDNDEAERDRETNTSDAETAPGSRDSHG